MNFQSSTHRKHWIFKPHELVRAGRRFLQLLLYGVLIFCTWRPQKEKQIAAQQKAVVSVKRARGQSPSDDAGADPKRAKGTHSKEAARCSNFLNNRLSAWKQPPVQAEHAWILHILHDASKQNTVASTPAAQDQKPAGIDNFHSCDESPGWTLFGQYEVSTPFSSCAMKPYMLSVCAVELPITAEDERVLKAYFEQSLKDVCVKLNLPSKVEVRGSTHEHFGPVQALRT
jgi:hypothetical protein